MTWAHLYLLEQGLNKREKISPFVLLLYIAVLVVNNCVGDTIVYHMTAICTGTGKPHINPNLTNLAMIRLSKWLPFCFNMDCNQKWTFFWLIMESHLVELFPQENFSWDTVKYPHSSLKKGMRKFAMSSTWKYITQWVFFDFIFGNLHFMCLVKICINRKQTI